MKIYNTLTRRKEEFTPIEDGKVRMYVCGPTVYNDIHIGNARPMIVFDTVRRYFQYKGYDVNFVSNFTDVDDKIIKKSVEEGVPAAEISERYIKSVKEDMEKLNILPATTHPKATEEISGMIEMIRILIDKGHAYEKNGTVYFRTRSFPEYGKLSKKNIDDLESGHRDIKVAGGEEKEDPLDFVLWKPKKDGEPFWESPWSEGRPGWHIECSVMSKKYLGDEIDIHAGGEDLIFPHHENEIAQSEAANGKQFSRYWMHNGYLNIDNKKMSKSAGNFFTVKEIGAQFPYPVLRFFMLSGAHYRMPLNFSRELMEAAANGLERISNAVSSLRNYLEGKEADAAKAGEAAKTQMQERIVKFDAAMEDDFNTADAVASVFEMVKIANSALKESASAEDAEYYLDCILERTSILGLEFKEESGLLDEEIEAMIEERQAARKAKDFKRADEIRNELLGKGIVLEDTREGVRWKKA